MNWEKSQAKRVCDECFEGDLPAMHEHAELYLESGHEAVQDLGNRFREIIGNQNRTEWWKRALKTIEDELQKYNDEDIAESPSDKQFDGFVILEEASLRLKIDLTALVAETGLWANPEVHKILVRDSGTGAWFPNIRRARSNKGEERREIDNGVKYDDNSDANRALKTALGLKVKGKVVNFTACHIWDRSCYDEFDHTTIANLVLLPSPLSTLADHHQGVKTALKYRAYELYGWHPKGTAPPIKPASYPSNWRAPLPFNDQIKNSIQRRRNKSGDY